MTQVPVADPNYYCSPKLAPDERTFWRIFARAMSVLIGLGLKINGRHTLCGDYIYSGHTIVHVVCYLFIRECRLSLNSGKKTLLFQIVPAVGAPSTGFASFSPHWAFFHCLFHVAITALTSSLPIGLQQEFFGFTTLLPICPHSG